MLLPNNRTQSEPLCRTSYIPYAALRSHRDAQQQRRMQFEMKVYTLIMYLQTNVQHILRCPLPGGTNMNAAGGPERATFNVYAL